MPHITIAAEKIFQIGNFWVTNSLLTTWIVMAVIFIWAYLSTRNLTMVPSSLQSVAEMLIGGLYDFFGNVAGKHIKIFFSLLASIFIFVIIANWIGLLPGVGTIGFYKETKIAAIENSASTNLAETTESIQTEKVEKEFVPLLRGATADINTTLALAITAVIGIQYFGFKTGGFKYSKRFIDISNPINFFIGVLEIVSEFSKIISFAFRLFGNIFAGEVLLTVMAFLMPFIAPLPFLTLELFVGFIQALVFSMLTAVFLNVAVAHVEHEAQHQVAK
jgi:F-type H+-transporting ATPase subunit a